MKTMKQITGGIEKDLRNFRNEINEDSKNYKKSFNWFLSVTSNN